MAFDFTETVTLHIPNVEEQMISFSESFTKRDRGIIVEIAAIHRGLTQNYTFYSEEALAESIGTWVSPYPKPIIMNHDLTSEPLGRVMAAQMAKEEDGTPFVMLQTAITDPNAAVKVLDQRYLTGSVGGKAGRAICSICEADWANASMGSLPCSHKRGKTYKGKLAFLSMEKISFKEYSIVNAPADSYSGIRSIKVSESGEFPTQDTDWTTTAKIFSINMNEEEVLEFSESASNVNLLEKRAKKDIAPVYMQIKGAFLSALATAESLDEEMKNLENDSNQENKVITDEKFEEEEDILAVAENLSLSLQDMQSVTSDSEDNVEEEEDETVAEADSEGDVEDNVTEEEVDAELSEDEEGEDVSEDSEDEIEASDEVAEEDEEEQDEAAVSEDADAEEEIEEEEVVAEDEQDSETELDESEADVETLESRVEELESECANLKEQNVKLRSLLKKNLAERVVDMKIALGVAESEGRAELIEEHEKRSASSLADSLKDLATLPRVGPNSPDFPQVTEKSSVAEEGEPVLDYDLDGLDGSGDSKEKEGDPEEIFTERMVEVLMGRRTI